MTKITCFKAYDVRGRVPDQLNADICYRIGRAVADYLKPGRIVVGRDIRHTSEELCQALTRGLASKGVQVFDIGQGGTEQVYFATFHERMDGGIMVTASHNPADFNGLKFVREDSRPISADTGLEDIRRLAEADNSADPGGAESVAESLDIADAYIEHLLGYVNIDDLKPLKIVSNPGNAGAGTVIDWLALRLPFEFIRVHHQVDADFPNGIPNPLLPENRPATIDAVVSSGADIGIAWDGDFDRCFFFDELGQFVDGYYIVGLLAGAFLQTQPGASIIYDPRLTWNTVAIVEASGGVPIMSKSGHSFIKERMRAENAVYGGEMSAHHYFRDFAYCDSGMLPWLLVAQLISTTGKSLSELVADRVARFPASGEINRQIDDAAGVMQKLEAHYSADAVAVDHIDGLSMEFAEWRFNIRSSNTEPLVRLNVESRGDKALMETRTEELLALMS